MRFESINFPPYSNQELLVILKQRVEDCRALYPNSYSTEILHKIAAGDAMIAIQTLRNSAYVAERLNRSKITERDVEDGYKEVKEIEAEHGKVSSTLWFKDKARASLSKFLHDYISDRCIKSRAITFDVDVCSD